MTNHKFYRQLHHASEVQGQKVRGRQDDNQLTYMFPLTVVGAVLGGVGVGSLLVQTLQSKQQLQDHPMCGITTGGQVGITLVLLYYVKRIKTNDK